MLKIPVRILPDVSSGEIRISLQKTKAGSVTIRLRSIWKPFGNGSICPHELAADRDAEWPGTAQRRVVGLQLVGPTWSVRRRDSNNAR